jgi:DNA polymerase (family 10)
VPVQNSDVGEVFEKVADLLEIQGENQFRVRAYRDAARTVGGHSRSVAEMVEESEDLTELPGIGRDLAGKIREIVETGKLSQAEELERRTDPGLRELLGLPGLGPERVRELHERLGVRSLQELEEAARDGRISELPGFGKKTEQNILEAIEQDRTTEKRVKLSVAEQVARSLEDYLKGIEGVDKVVVAGSYRRRQETVGDLDVVAASKRGGGTIEKFVEYEDVQKVVSKGKTRSSVVLRSGLEADLRVVPKESFGAALLYFTGSQPHHVALRDMSLKKKLKINEYGVFKGDDRLAGKTEEEIYKKLGLAYVEPELRENRGELEAAHKNSLPKLVTQKEIRGDLHSHTDATDGNNTLEEMVRAAKNRGYDYLAITDHSKRLRMVGGLDEKRLRKQMEEIERLDDELKGITLLKGIEVDILEDGSLDLPDEVLKELDIVICSVHHRFGLSEERQTNRIIRAMENPNTNVIAHPTGRMIGTRQPYEVDMERVMEAAKDNGCFLELNSDPDRLDLNDVHCKMAKEIGVKISISTDAHSTSGLDNMRFGVGQARRGWLEKKDVINTRTLKQLRKLLKRS